MHKAGSRSPNDPTAGSGVCVCTRHDHDDPPSRANERLWSVHKALSHNRLCGLPRPLPPPPSPRAHGGLSTRCSWAHAHTYTSTRTHGSSGAKGQKCMVISLATNSWLFPSPGSFKKSWVSKSLFAVHTHTDARKVKKWASGNGQKCMDLAVAEADTDRRSRILCIFVHICMLYSYTRT